MPETNGYVCFSHFCNELPLAPYYNIIQAQQNDWRITLFNILFILRIFSVLNYKIAYE